MKTAALIPCRKGSKGIPNKNFKEIAGVPLWYWTAKAAQASGIFDKIILSSDGGFEDLGSWPGDDGRIIFDNDRPERFATDGANLDELMCHYYGEYPDIELWCLLQPTSPLRNATDIRKAHKIALREKYDSVVSVTNGTCMYWLENSIGMRRGNKSIKAHTATYHIHNRPNRQDRKGWWRENGAIYFTKDYTLKHLGLRLGGTIGLYKMPKERSFEIDDEIDWKIVEFMMNGKR